MKRLLSCLFVMILLGAPAMSAPRYIITVNSTPINILEISPEFQNFNFQWFNKIEVSPEPDDPEITPWSGIHNLLHEYIINLNSWRSNVTAWVFDTENETAQLCFFGHSVHDRFHHGISGWWRIPNPEIITNECVVRVENHLSNPLVVDPVPGTDIETISHPFAKYDPDADVWLFDRQTGIVKFCHLGEVDESPHHELDPNRWPNSSRQSLTDKFCTVQISDRRHPMVQ